MGSYQIFRKTKFSHVRPIVALTVNPFFLFFKLTSTMFCSFGLKYSSLRHVASDTLYLWSYVNEVRMVVNRISYLRCLLLYCDKDMRNRGEVER